MLLFQQKGVLIFLFHFEAGKMQGPQWHHVLAGKETAWQGIRHLLLSIIPWTALSHAEQAVSICSGWVVAAMSQQAVRPHLALSVLGEVMRIPTMAWDGPMITWLICGVICPAASHLVFFLAFLSLLFLNHKVKNKHWTNSFLSQDITWEGNNVFCSTTLPLQAISLHLRRGNKCILHTIAAFCSL